MLPSRAEAVPLSVQAVAGGPIGAGRVSVVLDSDQELLAAATGALKLSDAEHRVLYPVVASEGVLRVLRRLATGEEAWGVERFEIYFLFAGDAPLELTVVGTDSPPKIVTPVSGPRLHRNMLTRWWREYRQTMREQSRQGDYSPVIENYLANMLGNRLNTILPPAPVAAPKHDAARRMWDLLTGGESLEQQMLADVVSGSLPIDPPLIPLPPPVTWRDETLPAPSGVQLEDTAGDATTKIEPIATQVPDDCFYVRFGKFSNFLWLSDLTQEAGGDLQRMITLRGVQHHVSERVEQQLAIEELPFAKLLGDKVIADVALIGHDMLLKQGPAIGVILQEAGPVVAPGLTQLRSSVAKREAGRGCTLTTTPVGQYQVSLLSTPDNAIRSFYVARDGFHLITNCEAIAEAFLELPQSQRSLDRDPEFRQLREDLAVDRGDTVFAYLPRRFFARLASPTYQVELVRRLRSATEIQMVEIARRAYLQEVRAGWIEGRIGTGVDEESTQWVPIETLVSHQLLPRGFGGRHDGSRLESTGIGVVDSLRGTAGSFLPIPDVPVMSASEDELWAYREIMRLYDSGWQDWDPMAVALRRRVDEKVPGRESIEFTARVAPFNHSKYERWLAVLGEPTLERTQPRPEDILTIEAVVDGGRWLPAVEDHHLLLCLRDTDALPSVDPGRLLGKLQMAQLAPAYLAAWPELGLLRLFPLRGLARDLGDGYSALPFGVYRRDQEGYIALSFHPDLLKLGQPPVEQGETAAQLRVLLRDTSSTGWTRWINAMASDRALRASLGNVRFLHTLEQQLGISPEDSFDLAESLAGGTLTCSLGGKYERVVDEEAPPRWKSTAWSDQWPLQMDQSDEYTAPLVQWLRGLELQASLLDDVAEVTGTVTIQRHVDPATKQGGALFQLFKN
jgi:hypothetical protein